MKTVIEDRLEKVVYLYGGLGRGMNGALLRQDTRPIMQLYPEVFQVKLSLPHVSRCRSTNTTCISAKVALKRPAQRQMLGHSWVPTGALSTHCRGTKLDSTWDELGQFCLRCTRQQQEHFGKDV